MKKHDEGYILAYVFVILVVICIIATSVLTVPLANLKAQKAAVEKMQQQYQAQGRMEQMIAMLDSAAGKAAALKTISIQTLTKSVDEFEVLSADDYSCMIYFSETEGNVCVSCVLTIKSATLLEFTKDVNEDIQLSGVFTAPEYSYVSYSVDTVEGGEQP